MKSLGLELGVSSPWIMGIVNCTPDSFSDGGKHTSLDAFNLAAQTFSQAHIIDIGGESSAPGRAQVSAKEEIDRLSQLLPEIAKTRFVSVDTYKSMTASWAIKNGARMVNDISALRADAEMVNVVRDARSYVVLMYSRQVAGDPHATTSGSGNKNLFVDVCDFLSERIDFALNCGIGAGQIVLDPGMGFFVSPKAEDSWRLLSEMTNLVERFREFPILVGVSRKSFLGGEVQNRDPVGALTEFLAIKQGAKLVRTHRPDMIDEFLRINHRVCGEHSTS